MMKCFLKKNPQPKNERNSPTRNSRKAHIQTSFDPQKDH